MTTRVPTEAQEQARLARWLDRRGVCWTHVPNGGARNAVTGAKLKREGTKPGVPDVLIFDRPPGRERCGVAIELKRQNSTDSAVRPEQRKWLRDLDARGWVAFVARGADEAIAELEGLGF